MSRRPPSSDPVPAHVRTARDGAAFLLLALALGAWPTSSRAGAADTDLDCVADIVDCCPLTFNPRQEDSDDDLACDSCEAGEMDLEGVDNDLDNCPAMPNPLQEDDDRDRVGNVCDTCPFVPDSCQADGDGDGIGDACDDCMESANADQV